MMHPSRNFILTQLNVLLARMEEYHDAADGDVEDDPRYQEWFDRAAKYAAILAAID